MSRKSGGTTRPRYLQISDELVSMIRSGDAKVGDMLPTELELCERYGISRHTAREALRRVEDMGLVKRRRGSGTRVTAQDTLVVYNQFVTNLDQLMQYGQETKLHVSLARYAAVPDELAEALECKPGTELLHLSGVRSFHDNPRQPICATEIWIRRATRAQARALLDLERCEPALHTLLEFCRLSRVSQTLSADNLTRSQAAALRAKSNTAALVISRRYFDLSNRLILLAISTHPKERFRYSTELTAHGSGH